MSLKKRQPKTAAINSRRKELEKEKEMAVEEAIILCLREADLDVLVADAQRECQLPVTREDLERKIDWITDLIDNTPLIPTNRYLPS